MQRTRRNPCSEYHGEPYPRSEVKGLGRDGFGLGRSALRLLLSSSSLAILPLIALLPASSHALTISSVSVSPATVNSYAEYTIDATIASNSGSRGIDANEDSILVTFPAGVTLPEAISANLLTVNGTSCNTLIIRDQTVVVPSPVNVSKNAPISLVFSASANIRNPSSAGSSYSLSVTVTTVSPSTTDGPASSTFQITTASSTVSAAAVQGHHPTELVNAEYRIVFSVGTSGLLTANQSTISIKFPSGTTVPSGNVVNVAVNDVAAIAVASGDTVTVTTPVTIDNSGAVSLTFDASSGLRSPAAGTYTVQVWTSSEPTPIVSDSYTLFAASALRVSAFTPTPSTVNAAGGYQLHVYASTSGALAAGVDTITVIFPYNTHVPTTIPVASITLESGGFTDNPTAVVSRAEVPADADTIMLVTSLDVANSGDIVLDISSTAGLLNPAVAGNYTITTGTSNDTAVESNAYLVSSATSSVSQPSVSASPATPSTLAQYTVRANLGEYGRLRPDESTISLTFPGGTTIGSAVAATPSGGRMPSSPP